MTRNWTKPGTGKRTVQGNENLIKNDAGHLTKMAGTPIYGKKNLQNLLLRNRRANFHEAWYEASGTPAHHSLLK